MKHIIKLIGVVLLFSIFSFNAFSSNDKYFHPDTIRMQMPNGSTIEFRGTYTNDSEIEKNIDFKNTLGSFLKRWEVLNIKNLDSNTPIKITCTKLKHFQVEKQIVITIEEKSKKQQITFPLDNPVALTIKGKHTLELNSELAIYFDKIEQLQELANTDLSKTFENIDKQLHQTGEYQLSEMPFSAWLKIKNDNSAKLLNKQNLIPQSIDQIILSGGTSLENVKGDWNGGFYANMSFQLGRKSTPKHALKLEYEWMYDFSSDEKNINHWISLGYAQNHSRNPNKTNWVEITTGYLIKRKGDLFDKDTFRLGVNKRIHKNVSVEPQIYFNDFFEDVYPGFKIKIHL